MADGEAVHELAGAVSELEEDRRQGAVEPDAPGQGPGGAGVAAGGMEPAAEQELPGGPPAAAAVAAGGPLGNHGGGAQAGADRVPPDALRGGVREADRGGVCGASPGAARTAIATAGAGVGVRRGKTAGTGW